jgi:hypothetical protein
MKREGTIGIAVLIAIAAAAGISFQSGPKQGGDEGSRGRTAVTRHSGTSPRKSTECDDLREHLEDFLDAESELFPTPCDPGTALPLNAEGRADLKFVIATLPDPLHTHLSVSFDESTATIQEAAQDEGYDFDSSWLPWDQQEEQAYTHFDDQKRAEQEKDDREKQPGILLFRKTDEGEEQVDKEKNIEAGVPSPALKPEIGAQSDQPNKHKLKKKQNEKQGDEKKKKKPSDSKNKVAFVKRYRHGLVVFVVGEDATHGIHEHQFRNAVKWIEMLSAKGLGRSDRVTILGPSFSGSFASLAELLSDPHIARPLDLGGGNGGPPLAIYGGGVSGRESAVWFQHQMDREYGGRTPRVLFHSFVENDSQIVRRFLDYMKEGQRGFDYTKVAILSEDETAYGNEAVVKPEAKPEAGNEQQAPLKLFYPRDISALRGAYQTRSLFDSNPSSESPNQQRRSLPTDLADPAGVVHDSVRSYGANQTPLAQEAFLLQITTALRERGARYILLRGSNPLDQLFLTNFLRRLYPDARIVIVTSDLLFIRERGTTGLSGVMTLSTYPLSALSRHWTERPPLPANDRVFSSDGSEGLYNAFRLLINADHPDQTLPKRCRVSEPDWPLDQKAWRDLAESETQLFLPTVVCVESPIDDYAPPLWVDASTCAGTGKPVICSYPGPPVWLSVIGVNRFWPLVPLGTEGAGTEILAADEKSQPSQGILGPPLIMRLFLLMLAGFSLFHLFCCWRGSYMAKPSFRAYFAASGDPKQTTLIGLGTSLVLFLGLTGIWSCGGFSQATVAMPYSWFAFCCAVAMGLLALSACILHNRRVDQLNPGNIARSQTRSAPAGTEGDSSNLARETNSAATFRRVRKLASKPLYRMFFAVLFPLLAGLFFIFIFVVPLESALQPENRVLTYWRSMNLGSGLSPILPFVSFFSGLYIVFWYTLHGLALFGSDRPRLPRPKQLEFLIPRETEPGDIGANDRASVLNENRPATNKEEKQVLRMFTQDAADDMEFMARPLTLARRIRTRPEGGGATNARVQLGLKLPLTVLLFLLFWAVSVGLAGGVPIRSLGHENYAIVFLVWFMLSASIMLAMCWRMFETWGQLRQLLEYLDRMPLRRTMEALRGFSWGSVWKMSGNVLEVRYKLLSRQLESMNHTVASLERFEVSAGTPISLTMVEDAMGCLEDMRAAGHSFATWYLQNYANADAGDLNAFRTFQKRVANVCGSLLRNLLLPAWRAEDESLVLVGEKEAESQGAARQVAPLAKEACVRNAEEFVCLTYMGFVQNILGRLRTMAISIVTLFVSCSVAISTYPFDPRQALSGVLIALFVVSSATIAFVYAGMHRDATLSHVTNTTPGELGSEFWVKLMVFVSPPLLGLLARVFPGITDFFFAWLQPGLSSLK